MTQRHVFQGNSYVPCCVLYDASNTQYDVTFGNEDFVFSLFSGYKIYTTRSYAGVIVTITVYGISSTTFVGCK